MKRVDVALAERSYPVWIGDGLVRRASEFIGDRRCYLVTDANVASAGHSEALAAAVQPIGMQVLPPGEGHKDWTTFEGLVEAMLEAGVSRGDCIVALGGGVVGDMAGFAAAVLKRGCDYVQVPTTLLAQVDSSVGGKTGINSRRGKNMIGAFHQPAAVLIDIATLATLPERELRAGYAEVVKYGLLADADFFGWCEANGGELITGDAEARLHAIQTSVRAKAAIVAADERETVGQRALLNLGHSFGHALEAETGFSDRLLHGEAVAIGMVLAFRFSAALGLCDESEAERVAEHLASVGLPISPVGLGAAKSLLAHMSHDKKWSGGKPRLVLTRGVGRAFLAQVEFDRLQSFLAGACS